MHMGSKIFFDDQQALCKIPHIRFVRRNEKTMQRWKFIQKSENIKSHRICKTFMYSKNQPRKLAATRATLI